VLWAEDVVLFDFADSGLNGDMPANALAAVDLDQVVTPIQSLIEERRPDVVVTLDPDAVNDHRDHMRIGEATTVAFSRSAKAAARLYHWTLARPVMDRWLAAMKAQGLLEQYVDLELGRPEHEITTVVDVEHVIETRRAAIAEHRTQLSPFTGLSAEMERTLLSRDFLVRVVPSWEGGSQETDLFGDGAPAQPMRR